jgi:hypothetical protein
MRSRPDGGSAAYHGATTQGHRFHIFYVPNLANAPASAPIFETEIIYRLRQRLSIGNYLPRCSVSGNTVTGLNVASQKVRQLAVHIGFQHQAEQRAEQVRSQDHDRKELAMYRPWPWAMRANETSLLSFVREIIVLHSSTVLRVRTSVAPTAARCSFRRCASIERSCVADCGKSLR